MATPDAINFMARYGRGRICLAMTRERIEELGLPLMASKNESRHHTAFTVSIEAREGITTGISAPDRARTVATAIDPRSEERRVGKECVRTCRSRWSTDNQKKQTTWPIVHATD